ncbi:unnamed protein product [Rotaria sp. Silwood1]|nr:unnamed protein product [Rotaria sp. Silwood1]CAF1205655.1 unnamed protein product [Rotaria sp. Silwood1]CAF1209426.1 unnamed protein product [Rotaria sp. Silwood1]CAF3502875.1 unnamed protein product [Rotaria sp. Silwood1]CAF3502884.1 unnamed protein product [Rotaria sp. Silwood1]
MVKKNGQPFEIDNKRRKTIEKDDVCSLIIDSTQLDDKASYTLKAINKDDEIESPKMTLNVIVIQLKIKTDLPATLTVPKDEPIILTIQTDGKSKPQVKWFKENDEILTNQPDVKVVEEGDNTYKLIIDKATEKDQEEYSALI